MRPRTVTLIALYHAIIASDCALVALAALIHFTLGRYGTSIVTWIAPLAWGYLPFGGRTVFLLWMLLGGLASFGLWHLRSWGRILSIILGISWILAAIPYFVVGALSPQTHSFEFSVTAHNLVKIAAGTLIVCYLFQAKIKVLFRQHQSAPA